MKTSLVRYILPLFFFISGLTVSAQKTTGKFYPDGHGGKVYVPLGDIAFADEVVSYTMGTPAPKKRFCDSTRSIGPPDFYEPLLMNFVSLGCGGSIVLKFKDNVVTDVPGPDIFVFELGMNVESTILELSKNGRTWLKIGEISGGQCSVDISAFVKPYEFFTYIRLTDLKTACEPDDEWPGADIDAVAAIGAGKSFSLKSSVLFDFNKSFLKQSAQKDMDSVITEIMKMPGATVLIEGHTDSIGSKTYNLSLSQKRATAVSDYFASKLGQSVTFKTTGYGDQYPVAPNTTDEGREMNRRVEIVVIPGKGK